MKKISGIYKITIGDEFYIGATIDLYKRLEVHKSIIKPGSNYINKKMKEQIEKVGSFVFGIIERCSPAELYKRERFYIETLKPVLNIRYCYHSSGAKVDIEERKKKKREYSKDYYRINPDRYKVKRTNNKTNIGPLC